MPVRPRPIAILCCLISSASMFSSYGEDIEASGGKSPVEARLVVKQAVHVLPEDRHGEAFRRRIVEETDSDRLPPAPRVNLVLELKNISTEDVMIWPRGAMTTPGLTVDGPGLVEPENLQSFSGSSSGTSVQPTIKPGKTLRIPIRSLNPAGDTPQVYWNKPGDYSIRATYTVYTGLPPFPFPGKSNPPAGKPEKHEVTTPPATIKVVLQQPQRPLIVAHRGLLRHAPENTLANFRACLELRLGFEADVQRTGDGKLVCIHDATVDRTTDGVGHVAELSLNEIRRLDAGRWFGPRFAGEKVPTIDELFQLIAGYRDQDILVAVDLKASEVERDVVQLAVEHRILDKLLFIGTTISSPGVRKELKSASEETQTAVVANNRDEFAAALAAVDGNWVYFRYLPSAKELEAVHRAGRRAFIAGATVSGNLPDNWRNTARVGMDAVLTDHPLELRRVLAEEARRATGN